MAMTTADLYVQHAEQYTLPDNMPICEALHSLFTHYASPWKSSLAAERIENTIDGVSFVRMCQEAPGLASKKLTRHEFDIIFTKAKPVGERRLHFNQFLKALLDLANRKFPGNDPTTAFSKLLTGHLFGLFDISPSVDHLAFQKISYDIIKDATVSLK
jgi:hypothetical protein